VSTTTRAVLSEQSVLLLRFHHLMNDTAWLGSDAGRGRVIDVSGHAENRVVMLGSDALIADYSLIAFGHDLRASRRIVHGPQREAAGPRALISSRLAALRSWAFLVVMPGYSCRRSTRPARSAVSAPFATAARPLTNTCTMPSANWCGLS